MFSNRPVVHKQLEAEIALLFTILSAMQQPFSLSVVDTNELP